MFITVYADRTSKQEMQEWRSGESARLPPLLRVFLRVLRSSPPPPPPPLHKNQHFKVQFEEMRATGLSALMLVLPSLNKVHY